MKDKPKLLIVNQHVTDAGGGSEWQCHIIANTLLSNKYEVTYAVCAPLKNQATDYSVEYPVLLIKPPFASSFNKILKTSKPDVIYWRYNKKKLLIAVILSKLRGSKFVFAVSHINDVTVFSAKPYAVSQQSNTKILEKSIKRKIKQCISGVNTLAFLLIDGLLLQHRGQALKYFFGPTQVIYNSYAHPTHDEYSILPRIPDDPYIVWIANVKHAKNPDLYIKLAADFRRTPIKFLMIGEIEDEHIGI